MTRNRTRLAVPLLLATVAWTAGIVSTALHFHGVEHAVDAATGRVVHHGCSGHHDDEHGHHEHTSEADVVVLEANGAAGHHGPESCYHVSGLIHAASVLATAPAPPWSPRHRSLRTGDAPGTPAAAIDLLFLAPKLPPPPSRQI